MLGSQEVGQHEKAFEEDVPQMSVRARLLRRKRSTWVCRQGPARSRPMRGRSPAHSQSRCPGKSTNSTISRLWWSCSPSRTNITMIWFAPFWHLPLSIHLILPLFPSAPRRCWIKHQCTGLGAEATWMYFQVISPASGTSFTISTMKWTSGPQVSPLSSVILV